MSSADPDASLPPRSARLHPLAAAFGAMAAVAVTATLLITGALPREGAFMAGIFVLAAVYWVTEAVPLYVTSLMVIGLEALLLANPGGWRGLGFASGTGPDFRQILQTAADPTLMLFFGGFVLARAATKEGLDRVLSGWLFRPFGSRPPWVLLGLILITAFLSMWMSNTATAVMMLALIAPLLSATPPGDPFRVAVLLAVAFGANIGGIGTPIASPPNAVAVGFLQQAGQPVTFLDWTRAALPPQILLLGLLWAMLWVAFRPRTPGLRFAAAVHRLTPRGRSVGAIFAATVALWLTDAWHGLPAGLVALLPVILCFGTGLLNTVDLRNLDWNVLILIAGGIALGAGLQWTGLDRVVVSWLPAEASTQVQLTVILGLTLLLGTFMSNTATANLLLPIALSTGQVTDPSTALPFVFAVALMSALTMALPISTPPNAVVCASGEVHTRHTLLVGGMMGVIGWLLLSFALPWWLRWCGMNP